MICFRPAASELCSVEEQISVVDAEVDFVTNSTR